MSIADELLLRNSDLVRNAAIRLPVCLCVDASYSMHNGHRMQQVNAGVRRFIQEIGLNPYAVDSVELCIISFGGERARVEQEFALVRSMQYRDIVPSGKTPMGQALTLAMDKLAERNELYEHHGISAYHPWLIIISDGEATDDLAPAVARLLEMEKKREVKVLCVGIGDEANDLARCKADGEVIQLKDLVLDNFFAWLSKSMSEQSVQSPTMDLEIPGYDQLQQLDKRR